MGILSFTGEAEGTPEFQREMKDQPVMIKFQQGMKSTWKTKKFKNKAACEKWLEQHGDEIDNLSYTHDVW
jgi:hypothetical protein